MTFSTKLNRQQIKEQISRQLDCFTTFKWRGVDSWTKYNMLIINNKNQPLQFYNGPNFSNEYVKTKFQTQSSYLTGINFQVQTLSFKVAVYGVTIGEYQNILAWLSPYSINYLSFGYAQEYGYLVKLAGITDSERIIIGQEGEEFLYYTELELKWELQGPACARSNEACRIPLKLTISTDDSNVFLPLSYISTFLPTPMIVKWAVNWVCINPSLQPKVIIELVKGTDQESLNQAVVLAEISFQNIIYNLSNDKLNLTDYDINNKPWETYQSSQQRLEMMHFQYDSETSLITFTYGNKTVLLTYLTELGGDYLINSLKTSKYFFDNVHTYNYLHIKIENGNFGIQDLNSKIHNDFITDFDNTEKQYVPTVTIYSRKNIV